MSKQKISNKKNVSREDKLRRLDRHYSEFTGCEISVEHAFLKFIINQAEKGNSNATIAFYKRFYKKFLAFLDSVFGNGKDLPIDIMMTDSIQLLFTGSLGDVNQQTKNSYLRGFRAFGNYCEELGLLDGFNCSIKEVEPPIKQVYTEKELKRLL